MNRFGFYFEFYFFKILLLLLFYFTILYWFCYTSACIRHGCTRVPHPEPPSHLPPHTILLGHPSAPAPSFLYPVFKKKKKKKQTYNLDELLAAVFLSFSSFPVIFNSFNLFQEPTSDVLWGRTCKQRLGFVHQVVTQKRTRPKPPPPLPEHPSAPSAEVSLVSLASALHMATTIY